MKPRQPYLFRYQREDGSYVNMFRRSVQDLAAQRRWFKHTYPTHTLLSVEPDWTTPLLVELGRPENEKALQRLRSKCQWEHMSLTAVLLEWGDPREWGDS